MNRHFTILRRLSLLVPSVIALALLTPNIARADTITVFNVSGTAQNETGVSLFPFPSCLPSTLCSFSGTLTIDVTTGTATGLNLTFPGAVTFNNIGGGVGGICLNPSVPYSTSDWLLCSVSSSGVGLGFVFSTTQTPGSLVGFTGGTIIGGGVNSAFNTPLFGSMTGTIVPAVPEPSSILLFGTGVAAVVGIVRRKLPR